jgi:RNA polymerase sigma factor (sigma-70 family)
MASVVVQRVVERARSAAMESERGARSDGELLEAFLARRDEAAFAAILRRHGSMVLGVCQRVLGNAHDAEDAFQATFLVLVKKAASVRPRERVGHWLYGVAYRTALEARTMAARRRRKERTRTPPAPAETDCWDEVRPVLDRELHRLPENYRMALVLCDLEGKTRKEAARQLGWPEGTVAGRLARARSLLARRLKRHGIVLSAALLGDGLPQEALATVPATLARMTVRHGTELAAGQATAAGVVPAKVLALMEGVMKAMLFAKLRATLGAIVLVGFLGLIGFGSYGSLAAQDRPESASPADKATQPPKPAMPALRLPDGAAPIQALVSLKGGNLIVKASVFVYEPVTTLTEEGNPVTSYRARYLVRPYRFSLDDVDVREVRGKRVGRELLQERLKKEIPALIQWGPHPIDPMHLLLIKDGTLLFTLPASEGAQPLIPANVSPVVPPTIAPAHPELVPPLAPAYPQPSTGPATIVPARPSDKVITVLPPVASPQPTQASEARVLLKQGRALLQQGKLAEAEQLCRQIAALGDVRWGLFEDTPAQLGRDLQRARGAREGRPVESASSAIGEVCIGTRSLHIPLRVRPSVGQVQVLLSTDRGKSWKTIAEVSPDTDAISYHAPADGLYWFAVIAGPKRDTAEDLVPSLKIRVRSSDALSIPIAPPATPDPGAALGAPAGYIQVSARDFLLPFAVTVDPQDIAKLRLYASSDKGKTWQLVMDADHHVASFRYRAPADGYYWFSVEALRRNQPVPTGEPRLSPQLKVHVNATGP